MSVLPHGRFWITPALPLYPLLPLLWSFIEITGVELFVKSDRNKTSTIRFIIMCTFLDLLKSCCLWCFQTSSSFPPATLSCLIPPFLLSFSFHSSILLFGPSEKKRNVREGRCCVLLSFFSVARNREIWSMSSAVGSFTGSSSLMMVRLLELLLLLLSLLYLVVVVHRPDHSDGSWSCERGL